MLKKKVIVILLIFFAITLIIDYSTKDDVKNASTLKNSEVKTFATEWEPANGNSIEVASNRISLGVCTDGSRVKNYMDYRKITAIESAQYQYIHTYMTVLNDGLLVTSDGYIGVAMGSRYGPIGSKYIITTDSNEFKVVKVDEKSDKDTVNGCYHEWNNSIMEFVIDVNLASQSYHLGIEMGDFDYVEQFNGAILNIEMEK